MHPTCVGINARTAGFRWTDAALPDALARRRRHQPEHARTNGSRETRVCRRLPPLSICLSALLPAPLPLSPVFPIPTRSNCWRHTRIPRAVALQSDTLGLSCRC